MPDLPRCDKIPRIVAKLAKLSVRNRVDLGEKSGDPRDTAALRNGREHDDRLAIVSIALGWRLTARSSICYENFARRIARRAS